MIESECVIIGGGVVGLTLARELLQRGVNDIAIIEKESDVGFHASGRNSGVLHAGVYYPADTLKARFCLDGNRQLQAFCYEQNIEVKKTGKVIVARSEEELPMLYELEKRAKANGARVELIDPLVLNEIEPYAKTCDKALYSYDTAVVNPVAIMQALKKMLLETKKVRFYFDTVFIGPGVNKTIKTNRAVFSYKQVMINAAGAYADKIAHQYDVGLPYYFLPFKGIYRKLKPAYQHRVNGNIYPVPDLKNPFLGVHFTKSAYGDVYIGPTAIPAWGRENYGLLEGVGIEAFSLLWKSMSLLCHNKQFRRLAMTEPKKYLLKYLFQDAKKLVKELHPDWLESSSKVGLRPQLIDSRTQTLMMDFLVERQDDTIHILNAISPAFTSSMAFAKYVIGQYA